MARNWDIFCSVIDNFGDIGVCWRLARQISSGSGQSVRLWVDDLASFHRLCRDVDPARISQFIGAIEVRRWSEPFQRVEPADIVIEGFGVRLPDVYLEAMAARRPQPAWINLEYLSAESWVDDCHGLPSPHPRLPLVKHFYFPGYTPATGGLLMESGVARTRAAFQDDPSAVAAFWNSLGLEPAIGEALRVSLFCYENAALPALVEAWSSDVRPVVCVVSESTVLTKLSHIVDQRIEPGMCIKRRGLSIAAIPFLELDQYDRLLWACDVNFVRGEDSFMRAQLAARPLIWQAYPQQDSAHLNKISAFLERYAVGLEPAAGTVYCTFSLAWNRDSADVGRHWAALCSQRNAIAIHAQEWAAQLASGDSLAVKLARFGEDRLK